MIHLVPMYVFYEKEEYYCSICIFLQRYRQFFDRAIHYQDYAPGKTSLFAPSIFSYDLASLEANLAYEIDTSIEYLRT